MWHCNQRPKWADFCSQRLWYFGRWGNFIFSLVARKKGEKERVASMSRLNDMGDKKGEYWLVRQVRETSLMTLTPLGRMFLSFLQPPSVFLPSFFSVMSHLLYDDVCDFTDNSRFQHLLQRHKMCRLYVRTVFFAQFVFAEVKIRP